MFLLYLLYCEHRDYRSVDRDSRLWVDRAVFLYSRPICGYPGDGMELAYAGLSSGIPSRLRSLYDGHENMATFPTLLLYLATQMGGLGLPRFSDNLQLERWQMIHRLLQSDPGSQAAACVVATSSRAPSGPRATRRKQCVIFNK